MRIKIKVSSYMTDFNIWTVLSKILYQKRFLNNEIIKDLEKLCELYPQKLSLFENRQISTEGSGSIITIFFFQENKIKIITLESWNNTFKDISLSGKDYDRVIQSFNGRFYVA